MIRVVHNRNYLQPADRDEYRAEPPESGLLRDILREEALRAVEQGAVVYRSGQKLSNPLEQPVSEGDFVHVVNEPGDPATITIYLAITLFSSLVLKALMPRLPKPAERGDESSATYGFGGIQSNRTEGEPKPLCYGRFRAGGQVINEDTTYSGTGKAHAQYAAQLSFGEGPIRSIAGIAVDTAPEDPLVGAAAPAEVQINGTEAPAIGDVEVHVRLGTNQQEEMTSFRMTTAEVLEVGTELTQITTELSSNAAPIIYAWDSAVVQDEAFSAFGVSTDLNGPTCDRVRFVLEFPSGLYELLSNGAAVASHVLFAVRYQELTSGGVPITTGGNYGDGWVRLPHTIFAGAVSTVPFSMQIELPLYDPQTFTPVSPGWSLFVESDGTGTGQDAVTSGLNVPAEWVDGNHVLEMSGEAWVKPEALHKDDATAPSGLGANDIGTVIMHLEGVGKGFTWAFRKKTFHAAPGVTEDYWVPVFEVNNSGTLHVFELVNAALAVDAGLPTARVLRQQFQHFAFTYKVNVDGPLDRFRLYYQGELVHEVLINSAFLYSTGNLHVARDPSDTNSIHGGMDEVRLYARELSVQEVSDSYNGGHGIFEAPNPTKLVASYHCDSGSAVSEPDSSGYGNTLTFSGGAGADGLGFVLAPGPNNVAKESNWRVEIMRNSRDSVDAETSDNATLSQVVGLIDERFSYPNEPVLGVRVTASENLSGSIPQITAVVEGRILPVWDRGGATVPVFYPAYSANHAWVATDILLDKRAGLGHRFSPANIDAPAFGELADYCDERIYDAKGDRREGFGVSAGADAYRDLYYDRTVSGSPQFDGRGRIRLRFGASGAPSHWVAGESVGWYGEHAPTGYVDSNAVQGGVGGYEIESIAYDGIWWNVYLYWDRLDEGDPWADGTDLSASVGFPGGGYLGTVEGREVRHRFDGVLDKSESAWDVLQGICSTARAILYVDGNRVRARVKRSRSATGFVGQAQVLESTFSVEWDGFSERPNAYTVRFHDRELNWERSEVRYEHPSIASSSDNRQLREGSVFARGITRRSEAMRHAKYMVNIAALTTISGSFEMAPDGLFFEVGDVVVLAHDLMPWGDSGRILETNISPTLIQLDREITLESGETHYVRVRNDATGLIETAEIDTGVYPPGDYAAGTALPLVSSLSFYPQRGAPFLHYKDGDEFLAEIVDIELTADMKVKVAWANYDEAVYDDDFGDQTLAMSIPSGGVGGDQDGTPPANVRTVQVREGSVRGAEGMDEPQLLVSWGLEDETARAVSSVNVWLRAEGETPERSGEWELGATVEGGARAATLKLPAGTARQSYAVAVQPVSRGGAKQRPEYCAKGRCHVIGWSRYPAAASSFTATRDGAEVVFSWTTPTAEAGSVAEIRVGGWALGQPVAAAPPGVRELRLPAVSEGAGGTDAPVFALRLRTPAGRYSSEITTQVSDVALSTALEVREDDTHFFSDTAWEDFGTGWWRAAAPTTTLTDLQVTDGELEFSGSALVGYFQTPNPQQNLGWKLEEYFIEAFVVGRQVHPSTWEEQPFSYGDPRMQRMTWDGPVDTLPEETAACTLSIEISWKGTAAGSWSDWTPYRPGFYSGVVFRFRLTVTRPDTDHDVRLERFSTRISRVRRQRWERNPHRSQLLREVMA